MSYHFNVRADSLAAASAMVSAQLDKVEAQQPGHRRDRVATDSAVNELLALCQEPKEHHNLSVSVSGSCHGPEGKSFVGVSLSVHIAPVPTD